MMVCADMTSLPRSNRPITQSFGKWPSLTQTCIDPCLEPHNVDVLQQIRKSFCCVDVCWLASKRNTTLLRRKLCVMVDTTSETEMANTSSFVPITKKTVTHCCTFVTFCESNATIMNQHFATVNHNENIVWPQETNTSCTSSWPLVRDAPTATHMNRVSLDSTRVHQEPWSIGNERLN